MNLKFFKIVGMAAALVVCGAVCLVKLQAQPVVLKSSAASVTTNWVGCIVVGQENAMDRIARGPHPKAIGEVEIGLRSDGVVVWRDGGKP